MRRTRGYPRRSSRRIKTVKYSNETQCATGSFTITQDPQTQVINNQLKIPIIPSSSVQGTRKCKNFELSMTSSPWTDEDGKYTPSLWALVYVPQGTTPNNIQLGGLGGPGSLYEPNQNVIMSGVWPGDITTNYKVKSRLARNLNSGDSIYLVITPVAPIDVGESKEIVVNLNYAIAY